MPKLSVEDLNNLKEKVSKEMMLREGKTKVLVTVHMGTCGIASGARQVMEALMAEVAACGRDDIHVVASGCMGQCSTEPNVTVTVEGGEPVAYQKMDPERVKQVFKEHVLAGEVQKDFVLAS